MNTKMSLCQIGHATSLFLVATFFGLCLFRCAISSTRDVSGLARFATWI
ncbi:MAG: hypothetical protein ACI85N_001499 [Gammaproteobacteria bacterium]|jgi:hypothetical protein